VGHFELSQRLPLRRNFTTPRTASRIRNDKTYKTLKFPLSFSHLDCAGKNNLANSSPEPVMLDDLNHFNFSTLEVDALLSTNAQLCERHILR
jgi:hypothetical protein